MIMMMTMILKMIKCLMFPVVTLIKKIQILLLYNKKTITIPKKVTPIFALPIKTMLLLNKTQCSYRVMLLKKLAIYCLVGKTNQIRRLGIEIMVKNSISNHLHLTLTFQLMMSLKIVVLIKKKKRMCFNILR